ncbi:MAG: M14 family metallopeptidase [Planctomycetota bacterium]
MHSPRLVLVSILVAGFTLIPSQRGAQAQTEEPLRLLEVDVRGLDFETLAPLLVDLDVARFERDRELLEIIAHSQRDIDYLTSRRIPFTVRIADLVSHYASRLDRFAGGSTTLGVDLNPPFGQGSMGGYYTYTEIASILDQLQAQFPTLVSARLSLGKSIENRDLWAVVISDNPGASEGEPQLRYDALHHAREPQGMQTLLWFMLFCLEGYGSDPLATYLVNNREMWFIPCANPDGYVYNETIAPNGGGMWRKNRRLNGDGTRGVDLNRNYPYQWGYDDWGSSGWPDSEVYRGTGPASEPETAAMVSFITAKEFSTALSIHTYSDLWLYPYGYDNVLPSNNSQYQEISALATEVNGYDYGPTYSTIYPANGITLDYDHGVHGTMSWTPEIGGDDDGGFWPPSTNIVPLAEENLLAFQRTALAAGAFIRILEQTLTEEGDSDSYYEGGESVAFRLTVRNSGRMTPTSDVVARLTTASPYASIADGEHSFGALPPFSQANNDSQPLRLTIHAGAPSGTEIAYLLSLEYEGHSDAMEGVLVVGQPIPFIVDQVEVDVGWTAGVPGDNATTGRWVWADPIGTSYSGEDCNPEDDATPSPGRYCFVTGNGGGGPGDDDVDSGHTTLLSPTIDLSGVSSAYLTYARWFANLGNPRDDEFQVSISNDNGSSWTPLETVPTNSNSWTRVTFRVADYLPLSATMKLRFVAEDDPNNSLVEAAIDDLGLSMFGDTPRFNLYGRPRIGTPIYSNVTGLPGDTYIMFLSPGTADLVIPGIEGHLLLDPAKLIKGYTGTIPASRLHTLRLDIPNESWLIGITIYMQALVTSGATLYLTNRDDLTVE